MDLKAPSVQHKMDKKLISKVRKYSEKDEVFAQTQSRLKHQIQCNFEL